MASKKITRKQLLKEPDEFITFSGKLIQFARRHQKPLGLAAGAFFLCLMIVSGYSYYRAQTEKKAFGGLNAITKKYEAVRTEKGAEQAYAVVAGELERMVDKYGSTNAGRVARIVYANYSYHAKQYDQALASYQIIRNNSTQNRVLQSLMVSSLGYTYWQMSEFEPAIQQFNQITESPASPLKDDALYSLAALYRTTERLPERQRALNRIASDHPNSVYSDLATELIGPESAQK
jgi:predicted negative regulator of RcsB-dependent stress response